MSVATETACPANRQAVQLIAMSESSSEQSKAEKKRYGGRSPHDGRGNRSLLTSSTGNTTAMRSGFSVCSPCWFPSCFPGPFFHPSVWH